MDQNITMRTEHVIDSVILAPRVLKHNYRDNPNKYSETLILKRLIGCFLILILLNLTNPALTCLQTPQKTTVIKQLCININCSWCWFIPNVFLSTFTNNTIYNYDISLLHYSLLMGDDMLWSNTPQVVQSLLWPNLWKASQTRLGKHNKSYLQAILWGFWYWSNAWLNCLVV